MAARRGQAFPDDVVDLVLAGLHAALVVSQRDVFLVAAVRRCKPQQWQELLAIAMVFGQAFLEDGAELIPEALVLAGVVLGQPGQEVEHAAREGAAHGLDFAVGLQQLARDVEWQVRRVQHALHEAQVQGQELLGVVHDEHAAYVQLQAAGAVALPQVEGRGRRDVDQAGVVALALDAVVRPGQRLALVVRQMPVELDVLLVLDLGPGPRPERRTAVYRLVFERGFALLRHAHREGNVVGITSHQRAQAPGVEELFRVLLEVENDRGAALRAVEGLDGELAVGAGFPTHAFGGWQARTPAEHFHALADDERRVEADAELADELGVLLLVAREFLEEFGGAGTGDGAEMRDGVLAAHADAVVADAERALVLVRLDPHGELGVAGHQVGLRQRLETQLVVGVGGVGYQLTQEDLPVAVQRMDHELQQLTDFGLEAEGFFLGGRHGAGRLRAPFGKFKSGT